MSNMKVIQRIAGVYAKSKFVLTENLTNGDNINFHPWSKTATRHAPHSAPADKRRKNNSIMTSERLRDVVLTS